MARCYSASGLSETPGGRVTALGTCESAGGARLRGSQFSEHVLLATKERKELTFCKVSSVSNVSGATERKHGVVFTRSSEQFARIDEVRGTGTEIFRVTPVDGGASLHVHGELRQRRMNIVAEGGLEICTISEGRDLVGGPPQDECYEVRVAPDVDAGLVLITLLALDRLCTVEDQGPQPSA